MSIIEGFHCIAASESLDVYYGEPCSSACADTKPGDIASLVSSVRGQLALHSPIPWAKKTEKQGCIFNSDFGCTHLWKNSPMKLNHLLTKTMPKRCSLCIYTDNTSDWRFQHGCVRGSKGKTVAYVFVMLKSLLQASYILQSSKTEVSVERSNN